MRITIPFILQTTKNNNVIAEIFASSSDEVNWLSVSHLHYLSVLHLQTLVPCRFSVAHMEIRNSTRPVSVQYKILDYSVY